MTPDDMHIRRMTRDEVNTLVRRLIRSRLAGAPRARRTK
jgi:hypothetical protein